MEPLSRGGTPLCKTATVAGFETTRCATHIANMSQPADLIVSHGALDDRPA